MSKVQITAFTGEYHFLSNYCACPVTIDGLTYRSAEAAFQAAKCNVPIDRAAFCTVPPNVAKAIGRKIKLRKGWEKERDGIMADVIHAKFSQNPALAQALIDTGDAELIEGNTWNDNYCRCYGLEFDAVNDNTEELKRAYGTNPRKIGADYYIDDKAMPPDLFVS